MPLSPIPSIPVSLCPCLLYPAAALRPLSLERCLVPVPVPDPELDPELELSYASERILSLRFPPGLRELRHRQHLRLLARLLQARHRQHYMVSAKRDRMGSYGIDFGWPDPLAPPLDKLCCVCKALEGWLRGQPQRLAVLHCKGIYGLGAWGGQGHPDPPSLSAEQALSTLSMRKFCEEKVAMEPSQRRAVELFGALLSGRQRLSSSPVFLQHVLLPPLPRYGTHGCQPFLKIYQALQLVYTSGVTCYHRHPGGREPVFRAQFHTGTLRGGRLRLPRGELDLAWEDERFPPEGSVEFVFSSGPERIQGWDPPGAPPAPVDYGVLDPAVRRDSYEGFDLRHQDSLEGTG
uniref:Uncharacterized protein n=1 Tax=Melopsittacus undulatus TaxID=13146 RepID=A0A8V5GZ94_MELUD